MSTDTAFGRGSSDPMNTTGVVKDLNDQNVDISSPDFDFTFPRSQAISYGPVVRYYRRTLLVHHSFFTYSNKLQNWNSFTIPCFALWTSLLSMLWLLGKTSYSTKTTKIVLSTSFMLFTALFNGKIIGTRSSSKLSLPFSSMVGSATSIENDGYRLLVTYRDSAVLNTIMLSEDTVYKQIQNALSKYPSEFVTKKDIANLILEDNKRFSYDERVRLDPLVSKNVREFKFIEDDVVGVVLQGMMFDRKRIKLKEIITRATLVVVQLGLINGLETKYWSNSNKPQQTVGKTVSPSKSIALRWDDVATMLLALICMEIMIILVIVIELINFRFRNFLDILRFLQLSKD